MLRKHPGNLHRAIRALNNMSKSSHSTSMEISVANAISDAAYYALASQRLHDLKSTLTSLRWVQSRFSLESSLGGVYGVDGLLRDFTLAQDQVSRIRGSILRREGVRRDGLLSWLRSWMILIRCNRASLTRYPVLTAQAAYNEPNGSDPRRAAERLLRKLRDRSRFSQGRRHDRVWLEYLNKPASSMVGVFGPFEAEISRVAVSPNGEQIALALKNGTLRLIRSDTGTIIRELIEPKSAAAVEFDTVCRVVKYSSDSGTLLSADLGGNLMLHDALSGEMLLHMPRHRSDTFTTEAEQTGHTRGVSDACLVQHANNKHHFVTVISAGLDGKLAMWSVDLFAGDGVDNTASRSGGDTKLRLGSNAIVMFRPTTALRTDSAVLSVSLSHAEKICAAGLVSGDILIVDASSPNIGMLLLHTISALRLSPHSLGGGISALAFRSPQGSQETFLAIGTTSGDLSLWVSVGHTREGQFEKAAVLLDGHSNAIVDMCWSRNAGHSSSSSTTISPSVLITGSMDQSVKIWDPFHGASEVLRFSGHRGGVKSVDVGTNSAMTVYSAAGRTVRVWDFSLLTKAVHMIVSDDGSNIDAHKDNNNAGGTKKMNKMRPPRVLIHSITDIPVRFTDGSQSHILACVTNSVLSKGNCIPVCVDSSAAGLYHSVDPVEMPSVMLATGLDAGMVRLSTVSNNTRTMAHSALLARPDLVEIQRRTNNLGVYRDDADTAFVVSAVKFSRGGSALAVGWADGSAALWTLHAGSEKCVWFESISKSGSISCVSFFQEPSSMAEHKPFICLGAIDGSIALYDNAKKQPLSASSVHRQPDAEGVCAITFVSKQRLVSVETSGVVRVYSINLADLEITPEKKLTGQQGLSGSLFFLNSVHPCHIVAHTRNDMITVFHSIRNPVATDMPNPNDTFATFSDLMLARDFLKGLNQVNVEAIEFESDQVIAALHSSDLNMPPAIEGMKNEPPHMKKENDSSPANGIGVSTNSSVLWRESREWHKCDCHCIDSLRIHDRNFIVGGFHDGRCILFCAESGRQVGLFLCPAAVVCVTATRDLLMVGDALGGLFVFRLQATWVAEEAQADAAHSKPQQAHENKSPSGTDTIAGSKNVAAAIEEGSIDSISWETVLFPYDADEMESQKNEVVIKNRDGVLKTGGSVFGGKKDEGEIEDEAPSQHVHHKALLTCLQEVEHSTDAPTKQRIVQPLVHKIWAELGETTPSAIVCIFGGADGLFDLLVPRLRRLLDRGVIHAASRIGDAAASRSVVVDGGTLSGVMKYVGSSVRDLRRSAVECSVPYLVGCAPAECCKWPRRGRAPTGSWPASLEPNHDMFILAGRGPSSIEKPVTWGFETLTMFSLIDGLRHGFDGMESSAHVPAIAILSNGGEISKREALQTVRAGIPLILVQGSGRVCDRICRLRKLIQTTTENLLRRRNSVGRGSLRLVNHRDMSGEDDIRTTVQGLTSLSMGEMIHSGDHQHDSQSVMQEEDDDAVREIASAKNVFIFPLTGDPERLAEMVRQHML